MYSRSNKGDANTDFKKLLVISILSLLTVNFLILVIVYNYYQLTLEKHTNRLVEVVENKKNYIELFVDSLRGLDKLNSDVSLQKALRTNSSLYGFGGLIDVTYISQRPSGLIFLFRTGDQEKHPLLEVKTYHELKYSEKQVLNSFRESSRKSDYKNNIALEHYAHLEGLSLTIIAKTDLEKIQVLFLRYVFMALAFIDVCFALGLLLFKQLNLSHIKKTKKHAERNNELITSSGHVLYTFKYKSRELTYLSESIKDLIGFKKEEILEVSGYWIKRIHPKDFPKIKAKISTLFKEGKAVFEYRFRNKVGQYIWIQDTARILKDEHGNINEIIGSWLDVSKLKSAEIKLQEKTTSLEQASQYLTGILNTGVDAIIGIEADGNIISTNPATELVFGYKAREMLGQNVKMLMPISYQQEHDDYLRNYIQTGKKKVIGVGNEVTGQRKDGSTFPMELSISELNHGGKRSFIGFVRDISERKKAEEEIRQGKEYSENLLENLSTPTFVIDSNHIVLHWNKACEELTGLSAEKVIGTKKHWRGFYRLERPCLADVYIDQLSADELFIVVKESGNEQSTLHAENWCSMYSGQRLYLGIDVGPVFDKEGNLIAVIENLRDLTEHRNLEIELMDARDKALEAVNTKGQFLANMSHEIRTPMNGVLGMLDLIKQTKLSKEQKELTNTAFYSAESLLDIINEILDFSKLDAGQLQIEIIKFNLQKLVSDIQHIFTFKSQDKGIGFNVYIDEQVPTHVFGDPTRLRQILINLLGNAVKFTEKGNVNLRVKVRSQFNNDINIEFNIEDSGIGILPDKQHSLFDEFSQVDASTTRKFGGTGLGLTITKKLLDLLNGSICVESALGKGSTFSVTMPFEIANERRQPGPVNNVVSLSNKEAVDLGVFSQKRVLLVEDNKVNQKVALGLLKKFSLKVDVAENGKQALMKFKRGDYQLVLMDCQMPVMDGYQATAAIRQYQQSAGKENVVIIAMTANAMQGDKEKCLAAGMNDYLSKPVDKELLKEKLYFWLSKKEDHNREVSTMSTKMNTDIPPVLDKGILEELKTIMEDEFTEVLQVFLEESINLMSDVHAGFSDESDKLLRAVHTLKSSGNNVGAKRLGSLAAIMEALVKNEEIDAAKTHLDELQDVFTETHALMKKYMQDDLNDMAV